MAFKIGNTTPTLNIGSAKVLKLFVGSTQIYAGMEKLSPPTSLTASGTEVTFVESANATSYEVYADGVLIGESAGEAVANPITVTLENCTAGQYNPDTIMPGETITMTYYFDGTSYCCPETGPTVTGATGEWIKDDNTTGRLVLSDTTGDVSYTVRGKSAGLTELCFTANTAGSTVELIAVGSPSISNTAYSTDRVTWTTFTPSTTVGTNTITLTNVGDKVYFRNDITANLSSSNYLRFKMSGSISASGNINSMYDADNYNDITTLSHAYCYYYMFYGCTSLTTAPSLPATTLANSCYNGMFRGCTSLTTAPSLPTTTLANSCYYQMFYRCTSLTTAPSLPATTLASNCYNGMFYGCTSLTTAPSLPATTLATSCYSYMFAGCTSLTTTPALPATTLATSCYGYMFSGCTSLTTTPALPATTLATSCYSGMFYGCTSLTTAPSLPATTLANYCYYYMFNGCTSLTTAPALPATTLASNCYDSMFYGCTSLTTAPALPATTLASNCYQYMFYRCTSLYVSDTQRSEAPYEWHIPTSGTFTNTTTYNQNNMFASCSGTRSSDTMSGALGESHTYYTQNQPV